MALRERKKKKDSAEKDTGKETDRVRDREELQLAVMSSADTDGMGLFGTEVESRSSIRNPLFDSDGESKDLTLQQPANGLAISKDLEV